MNKRIKKIKTNIDKNKKYSIEEAVNILTKDYKSTASANFDETVEIVFKLKNNKKKETQYISSFVYLPHRINKNNRIAAIVNKDLHENAKKAGADIVGLDDVIKDILKKKIKFDYCVTVPQLINKVIKIAKVLGPKGMMPNINDGTISTDISKTIKKIKRGAVRYKTDEGFIINIGIAKLSFNQQHIIDNIIATKNSIEKIKIKKAKKKIIKEASITTTHGPSIKLDLSSFI